MSQNYGIVASGGGISCAYSVGVSLALVELDLTKPKFIICSSGSAGTFTYWTAGQYEEIRNIWENLLPTPKFVSLWRFWKIMDIDYLIDGVFKKQEPLIEKSVSSSNINLLIGATAYTSGDSVFFNNHDGLDIFEILRASKALPVAYNKNVRVGKDKFIDGDMSISMEAKIPKARELGFNKLIVINNEQGSFLSRLFLFIYSCFVNKNLGAKVRANSKATQIHESEELITITPSKPLTTGALGNNKWKIKNTIELGRNDTINNVRLQDLAKSNK